MRSQESVTTTSPEANTIASIKSTTINQQDSPIKVKQAAAINEFLRGPDTCTPIFTTEHLAEVQMHLQRRLSNKTPATKYYLKEKGIQFSLLWTGSELIMLSWFEFFDGTYNRFRPGISVPNGEEPLKCYGVLYPLVKKNDDSKQDSDAISAKVGRGEEEKEEYQKTTMLHKLLAPELQPKTFIFRSCREINPHMPCLLTQYIECENLYTAIYSTTDLGDTLNKTIISILASLLAVYRLHRIKYLHNDLKVGNVIIAKACPSLAILIDYQFAGKMDSNNNYATKSLMSTYPDPHTANDEVGAYVHSPASDLFSLNLSIMHAIGSLEAAKKITEILMNSPLWRGDPSNQYRFYQEVYEDTITNPSQEKPEYLKVLPLLLAFIHPDLERRITLIDFFQDANVIQTTYASQITHIESNRSHFTEVTTLLDFMETIKLIHDDINKASLLIFLPILNCNKLSDDNKQQQYLKIRHLLRDEGQLSTIYNYYENQFYPEPSPQQTDQSQIIIEKRHPSSELKRPLNTTPCLFGHNELLTEHNNDEDSMIPAPPKKKQCHRNSSPTQGMFNSKKEEFKIDEDGERVYEKEERVEYPQLPNT